MNYTPNQQPFEITNMKDIIDFDANWKVKVVVQWTNMIEDN